MPIYDFECAECGAIDEYIVAPNITSIDCQCGYVMIRRLSAPAGINGNSHEGYRHKSGTTGKWKSDVGPNGPLGKEWYGDNPHAPSTLARPGDV